MGSALVAFSVGPYGNWDQQLEFEASTNIAKMGLPYVEVFGNVIDQPPVGFYTEAACYASFGATAEVAVTLVTLFGVATTGAIYFLGRHFYSTSVGLVAAALFGLNPWHLIFSRTALIDVECLFFSLLCLLVGVHAIQKRSNKLALATGIFFTMATLTKFYAVFVLIPLLAFYWHRHPMNPKRAGTQIAFFTLPFLVGAFVWYQLFLGRPLLSVFHHNDFLDAIPASTNVIASPFFATNFLFNYGLGAFFLTAITFSLVTMLWFRKRYPKTASAESGWLAAIVVIILVNVLLGYGLSLNVPYFSAFKYLYQALPYFALLAASLVVKANWFQKEVKSASSTQTRWMHILASASALILLIAALSWSAYYTNQQSTFEYLQFRVEPQVDYGYALLNPAPLAYGSGLMAWQFMGFGIVFYGLALAVAIEFEWRRK
jgi:4-amino-4-deoxy-L-arabinose transferase-like glycosyltransferase